MSMDQSDFAAVVQVIHGHLLVGPRLGQCSCGHGAEPLPVQLLGSGYAEHLAEQLRDAGVLK